MTVLCILILINIRQQSHRIQLISAIGNDGSHCLYRHFIRMLFSQIVTQVLYILPFAILNLLAFLIDTSTDLFRFINQLFTISLFLSYITSFYIFTMSSHIYRQELVKCLWFRKARKDEREFDLTTIVNGQNIQT
ncbi:unnamed protein product [Rotaria sordida]|uniref:G protein-coupled receptor n=1 Tax=Rotaria sordida TaxID=392033 RepID=A0A814NJ26_9BILA|nr:unnamed protein product [Rotaria sordida]CAF1227522.1 unnamed protein product [Rotaria sordida]CAF1328593.1 unnamed protein product [Rotaria sordida]CAF1329239.1 unnamed protein product [Rotaria sordida]CAF4047094.1 unnamed protein product [Rotaria sordida]